MRKNVAFIKSIGNILYLQTGKKFDYYMLISNTNCPVENYVRAFRILGKTSVSDHHVPIELADGRIGFIDPYSIYFFKDEDLYGAPFYGVVDNETVELSTTLFSSCIGNIPHEKFEEIELNLDIYREDFFKDRERENLEYVSYSKF